MAPEELRVGQILGARVHLLESAPMWKHGAAKLEEDPFFFVAPRTPIM